MQSGSRLAWHSIMLSCRQGTKGGMGGARGGWLGCKAEIVGQAKWLHWAAVNDL